VKRCWEVIADNLSKAGWSWGSVSAIDSTGRTIWIADAHRGDGKRFVAVASANRSTTCLNARMAGQRRSHRSVPLIERDLAFELRSTPARHLGARIVTKRRRHRPPDVQLSVPALHLPTPTATG
jgi:hypothetical protein